MKIGTSARRQNLTGAATAVGCVAIGVASYFTWLNLPPGATIPTPVLPSPNGHDALLAAANLEKDYDAIAAASAIVPKKDAHVYSLTEKEKLVNENRAALDAARKALVLPFWNPPIRSATALTPEFAKYRGLARLFALQSEVLAAHSDFAGAIDSCLDAIAIGNEVPRGGYLVASLVGGACESLGVRHAWPFIDRLDANAAAAAAKRLDATLAGKFPFHQLIEEEKWASQAVLVENFNGRSTIGAYRNLVHETNSEKANTVDGVPPALMTLAIDNSLMRHSKRRVFEDYSEMMDAYAAQADEPYAPSPRPIDVPQDPFSQLIYPDVNAARFKQLTAHMESGLLLCALALRAYRQREGRYPDALAALETSGLLHHVPDDPFAPALGHAFGYRRVGGSYVLYSDGADGIDDGGKPVTVPADEANRVVPKAGDRGDWVVGVNIGKSLSAAD